MPLHLLGKKSWNVYNPENIARVRRDEAEAKAREEEEERRMQEIDAERRIQILRGERPSTPPPPPSAPSDTRRDRTHGEDAGRYRKRRRLAGENDTDRDIRLAREDAQLMLAKREELAVSKTSDAPLLDSTGHINLFPSEATRKPAEKNQEAEKEAADKNRSYEDQYTMRFSNAAGYRQPAGQMPWYSSSSRDVLAPDAMPEKDVWGNEDPMRQERERARLDANDPLAAIKRGVRQLKTRNRGARTGIARIAAKEVAIVLAIIPTGDTATPIRTPIRTVIVITMTKTEGKLARRSRTNAMRDTFHYGSLVLM
ncbi:uncharacterized protein C5E4.10c [Aspergillus lentulus]|uniref:Uncharacterized protein C5E4.10c n=1 Tax=Aspergillus lentulus TaxID=293939 RepID=A0ABQ1B3T8_ASPLE|nr:uncharacterized protein C5E4.10c [Aspergillus lentulus]